MPAHPDLPVIVLSNRGPVSFRATGERREVSRGAGGLVTALVGLAAQLEDAVWVCGTVTSEDAVVAHEHEGRAVRVVLSGEARILDTDEESPDGEAVIAVRLVDVEPAAHEDFYGVISNPLLWFVQHGMYDLATSPVITQRDHDAWTDGYEKVNGIFADAVVDEVRQRGGSAVVMLHDYHFYLVADRVRSQCDDVILTHFVHIPWPSPDGLRVLPPYMRDAVLRGLLGNDVVAFHTHRFARNFLLCAQELLSLPVDLRTMSVQVDGRTVHARTYPISIDVESLEELAASDAVTEHADKLERTMLTDDRQLIVRVDRTDPSKNIVRGFLAFDRLLDLHPELVGKVTFLALLQPSRQDVPEYADYLADIGAAVARVNAKYVREGQQPVDLRLLEDLPLAVAAYALSDVLMVNAVRDGMNLVAKEALVVSRRETVLLLSENAGAHDELGRFAVTVHPFDVEQQAQALYQALTMPAQERRERRLAASGVVRRNDVSYWLQAQIDDLVELTGLTTHS